MSQEGSKIRMPGDEIPKEQLEKEPISVTLFEAGKEYRILFLSEPDSITLKSGVRTMRYHIKNLKDRKDYVLLNAHVNFANAINKFLPVTGRAFIIRCLGSQKISGGRKAYRYEVTPLPHK